MFLNFVLAIPKPCTIDVRPIVPTFQRLSSLMRDPKARARAARAFEALLDACRAPGYAISHPSAAAPSGRRR